MRVNPGTGRIYQLSPTSRMGATPLPSRPTAPLARPAEAAAPRPKASFWGGVKGFFGGVARAIGNAVGGFFGLFAMGSARQDYAGRVTVKSGGGGSGTV